ncbi:SEC-C metal-binding domain-containing protein [Parachlamydia sp. AcF125]|uniref:SEC-C metal-binding domain-containing protein n=1 Tax=Parachlamydia sp. AcF125 TaxID=2795736 RepID=UPI001BC943CC|nr:SEC-C metal-binding domain-containing protein [Parachlamydia sp. AcF125]MBS4168447.1 Protein translocase subunit SecA [Parachlamydia sp. AcF125]
MTEKIGRNEPCTCGSGKKYKNCCLNKSTAPRKFTAKWLGSPQKKTEPVNLMERTFGEAIAHAAQQETPPLISKSFKQQSEDVKENHPS